jgi:predicted small lipoprotein YifL
MKPFAQNPTQHCTLSAFEPNGLKPQGAARVLTRVSVLMSALCLTSVLSACGQKGPLYLPSQKPTTYLSQKAASEAPERASSTEGRV